MTNPIPARLVGTARKTGCRCGGGKKPETLVSEEHSRHLANRQEQVQVEPQEMQEVKEVQEGTVRTTVKASSSSKLKTARKKWR